MKQITLFFTLLFLLAVNENSFGQSGTPIPDGPYLGQKVPGLTPEVFAPGIVSTKDWEIEGVFAPNMKEFYFARYRGTYADAKTYVIQYVDGAWKESVIEPRKGEVFISADGNRMHLGNKYRDRTESGWSEKKSLGPFFEAYPIMRLTASKAGMYVFDEQEKIGTIRYSRIINGLRQKPQKFGDEINSGTWTAHPFIASDETYLIWDSEREGGFGGSDLYISFRQENGSWGRAINMGGTINSKHDDAFGSVTPDGKFFFFHRHLGEGKANIFWVDAQVIENLRSQE